MASLLDFGAGAYSGLEDQLEREYKRQVEERLLAAQQEQARHNMASEGLQGRTLEQNAQLRTDAQESLNQSRDDNRQNILRDDIRTRAGMRDKGDRVTPQEYEEETNIGKLPTGRYKKTEGTEYQPLPPDQEGPGRMNDEFEWLGTPVRPGAGGSIESKNYKLNGKRIVTIQGPDGRIMHMGKDVTNEPGLAPDQSDDRMLMQIQTPEGVFYGPRSGASGSAVPLPAQIQTQSVGSETSDAQLARLEEMFQAGAKDVIGPAEGRLRSFGQKVPGVPVDQTFANFEAASKAFENAVIKAITGAQMSEPEAQRILGQIPRTSDKPEVWTAKATQSRKNLQDLNSIIGQRAGGGGAPAAPGAPKRKRYDMDGNEIP